MIVSSGPLELGIAAAFGDDDVQITANARLIAKAPELLLVAAALYWFASDGDGPVPEGGREYWLAAWRELHGEIDHGR